MVVVLDKENFWRFHFEFPSSSGKVKLKTLPTPNVTFGPDLATLNLHQLLADGQTQPCAAAAARLSCGNLLKHLKQLAHILGLYPDAGVCYRGQEVGPLDPAVDPDCPFAGELNGVAG